MSRALHESSRGEGLTLERLTVFADLVLQLLNIIVDDLILFYSPLSDHLLGWRAAEYKLQVGLPPIAEVESFGRFRQLFAIAPTLLGLTFDA